MPLLLFAGWEGIRRLMNWSKQKQEQNVWESLSERLDIRLAVGGPGCFALDHESDTLHWNLQSTPKSQGWSLKIEPVDSTISIMPRSNIGTPGYLSGDDALDAVSYMLGPADRFQALLDPQTRALLQEWIVLKGTVYHGALLFQDSTPLMDAQAAQQRLELGLKLAICLQPPSKPNIELLFQRLQDPNGGVRYASLRLICNHWPDRLSPSILAGLLQDPDIGTRLLAARMLQHDLTLTEILFSTGNPQWMMDAIRGLSEDGLLMALLRINKGIAPQLLPYVLKVMLEYPQTSPLFLQALRDASVYGDPLSRRDIVLLIGRMPVSPETEALLFELLTDAQEEVLQAVLSVLAQVGTVQAVSRLRLRAQSLFALSTNHTAIENTITLIKSRVTASPGALSVSDGDGRLSVHEEGQLSFSEEQE